MSVFECAGKNKYIHKQERIGKQPPFLSPVRRVEVDQ